MTPAPCEDVGPRESTQFQYKLHGSALAMTAWYLPKQNSNDNFKKERQRQASAVSTQQMSKTCLGYKWWVTITMMCRTYQQIWRYFWNWNTGGWLPWFVTFVCVGLPETNRAFRFCRPVALGNSQMAFIATTIISQHPTETRFYCFHASVLEQRLHLALCCLQVQQAGCWFREYFFTRNSASGKTRKRPWWTMKGSYDESLVYRDQQRQRAINDVETCFRTNAQTGITLCCLDLNHEWIHFQALPFSRKTPVCVDASVCMDAMSHFRHVGHRTVQVETSLLCFNWKEWDLFGLSFRSSHLQTWNIRSVQNATKHRAWLLVCMILHKTFTSVQRSQRYRWQIPCNLCYINLCLYAALIELWRSLPKRKLALKLEINAREE